jgi:lipoprotein-anchoring transpeptidase ErfK/SrfK
MVFKARQPTGMLSAEWPTPEDNLITSRILWLEGLEAGHNLGVDAAGRVVDTRRRFVYIHGTNQTDKLGRPNSHGCVLLSDQDVIRLYAQTPVGTPVLIRD